MAEESNRCAQTHGGETDKEAAERHTMANVPGSRSLPPVRANSVWVHSAAI
jgi:hypothetical protein